MKIEILDSTGRVIRTFDGPMEKGINRASWNLRRDGFKRPQLVPAPTQLTYLRQAESILEDALNAYNKAFSEDVAAYKEKVEQAKLSPFPEGGSLDLNWKPKKRE